MKLNSIQRLLRSGMLSILVYIEEKRLRKHPLPLPRYHAGHSDHTNCFYKLPMRLYIRINMGFKTNYSPINLLSLKFGSLNTFHSSQACKQWILIDAPI